MSGDARRGARTKREGGHMKRNTKGTKAGGLSIRERGQGVTTLRHHIRIEAPVEAVWKAVADLVAVQHYNRMVTSARFVSDRREGVGATRRCELKPKGWVEERVWEWSPPRKGIAETFDDLKRFVEGART